MSLQIVETKFGKVRLQKINEVTWFCGKDVCDVLGFINSKKAINDYCNKEDVTKIRKINFVNESGLYSLIFGLHKNSHNH